MAVMFSLASGLAADAQTPASEWAPEPLPVLMSYCIPGDTCLSCESEMPLGRVNKLLEINLNDAEVLLFKPDPVRSGTRDWKWFKTDEIFSRVVERKYGGIASPAADPPMCRDRAPLKGSIQPRDGVWKLTPSPTVMENCEGLDGPSSREPSRELRRWENPFRGRLAEEESFADIVQTSPNAFLGRVEIERDGLVGESLVEVHSPTSMKLFFLTRFADPAIACVVRFSLEMTWEAES
jgi:hypothetical protein